MHFCYCTKLLYFQVDTISSARFAECLLHDQIRVFQRDAYLQDKQELLEGKFGNRIFGKTYTGCMLLIDFTQLSPSSSRHKDFIAHEYSRNQHGTLDSHAVHQIGEPDQKEKMPFIVDLLTKATIFSL